MTHCCAQQLPDLPETCIQAIPEQESQVQIRLNPVQAILHLPAPQLRDDALAVVRGFIKVSKPVGKVVQTLFDRRLYSTFLMEDPAVSAT
jgi:hypothetical protein